MLEDIQDYLENTYNEKFELEKQAQNEYEYKFIITFKNLKIKYTYVKNYTFDYNMLYLKSQINKLITRFNLKGVEMK